jgi:FMN phosphatase YigB (HAD superfamily)
VIAVFDIDGVLADPGHRQHHVSSRPKDWDAFFAGVGEDALLEAGRARLRELSADHVVVLLSGRPESTRADTEAWLARHGIEVSRLVLRRDSDYRPAAQVKAELIAAIGGPDKIAIVVDDDESVTARLVASGYTTELFR